MHIGFDISQTGSMKAGCGYFAHALIAALLGIAPRERFSLYPSFGDFYFDVNMPADNPFPRHDVRYGPRHSTLDEARAFWTAEGLDGRLDFPDIVHSNNYWCPTQLASAKLVYTLHDLSFVTNPAWTTEINRAACWEGVSRAAAHADWIVAVSNASREHFLRVFPRFPEERTRVVHPCSRYSSASVPTTPTAALAMLESGRFWLSVGTIEPRKNQRRIAEAYAGYLAAGGPPMPLVLAGGYGWMMEDFREVLARLGLAKHVLLPGYVSDEDLAWLYGNCHAHIYFSHFEGFGLPVLEGMQFGAPTIASDTTSIPEVAGGAALLLKPEDTEGLTRAMLALARDPAQRARLSAAAKAKAARFDWRASAQAVLELYQEAAANPRRLPA